MSLVAPQDTILEPSQDQLFSIFQSILSEKLPSHGDFISVPTRFFILCFEQQIGNLPSTSLFKKQAGKSLFSPLRREDEPFSPLQIHEEIVWVRKEDFSEYKKFVENLVLSPKHSHLLSKEQRMKVLQNSAKLVVEDLFTNPSQENIQRGTKMVATMVNAVMREPSTHTLISQLSHHDPYTVQHSIGCSVNSIILGRKVGIRDEVELTDLGLAGLLHDIGKVFVKPEIINKPGPLDEIEWEEMQTHSGKGYEIIENTPFLSERAKHAVLEHHEDLNGTGYPTKKVLTDLNVFTRIVSLCDIYNALTTNRSYSEARAPFDAFKLIKEKLSHKVDPDLLEKLILVYGNKLD